MRRQEVLNVGIAIFSDGDFSFHFMKSRTKVASVCPNYQFELLPDLEDDIKFILGEHLDYDSVAHGLRSIGGLSLGTEVEFEIESQAQLTDKISQLMHEYVLPESNTADSQPLSLFHLLRRELTKVAELSSDSSMLDSFSIIERFEVDTEGWLKVEFAYKSIDKLNFIQTIDLRVDDRRELIRTLSEKRMVAEAIREAYKDSANITIAYRVAKRAHSVGIEKLLEHWISYASESHRVTNDKCLTSLAQSVAWKHGPNMSLPLMH